jgi:hypothetical protein
MIFKQLIQQLNYLSALVAKLDDRQYTLKIEHLGKASIGGHTRHIIELLQCVLNGYVSGEVDYINRVRDLSIEKDRNLAINTIVEIKNSLNKQDRYLSLATEDIDGGISSKIVTTYFREVVYNTEHTIHHLALIKVALLEMKLDLVCENFGMAYSTLKFKATLGEGPSYK